LLAQFGLVGWRNPRWRHDQRKPKRTEILILKPFRRAKFRELTPILHRRDAKFINHGWTRIAAHLIRRADTFPADAEKGCEWRSATHAHRSNRRQHTDTDNPAYQSAAGNRFPALGFPFLCQAQDRLM
jgi:hypothetical protein